LQLAAQAGHGAELADAHVGVGPAAAAGRDVLVERRVAVVVAAVAHLVRAADVAVADDRAVLADRHAGGALALVGAADEPGARAALVGVAVAVVVERVARLLHR